jgi:hypothetical protein
MEKTKNLYVVRCMTPDPDDGTLYWNNKEGWMVLECAEVYTEDEIEIYNLPIDGEWELLPTLKRHKGE